MTAFPRKGTTLSSPTATNQLPVVSNLQVTPVAAVQTAGPNVSQFKRKRTPSISSGRSTTAGTLAGGESSQVAQVAQVAQLKSAKRGKTGSVTGGNATNTRILRSHKGSDLSGGSSVGTTESNLYEASAPVTGGIISGRDGAPSDSCDDVEDSDNIDGLIRAYEEEGSTLTKVDVNLDAEAGSVEKDRNGPYHMCEYDGFSDPLIPKQFLCEELLRSGYYKGLVVLPLPFRPIKSFYYREEEEIEWMTFPNVVACLPVDAVQQLYRALTFTRYRWIFHIPRVRLDDTVVHNDRLRDADSRHLAVCMMVGVVTSCQLISRSSNISATSGNQVHQITVRPFGFEFCREQTYLGLKFAHDEIGGPIYLDGIKIRTSQQGMLTRYACTSSYSISKSRYAGVRGPMGYKLPVSTGPHPFEIPVDIYDSRHDSDKPFMFAGTDFESIRSWPLLKDVAGKSADPTPDSIVAVAYTVRKTSNGVPTMSLDLQFVIALHVPDTE